MNVNARGFVDALAASLAKECSLYHRYIGLLDEERGWLARFNHERVMDLSVKRASLYEEMLGAQDERLNYMRNFPAQDMKLRDLVLKFMLPQNSKQLLPLIDRLRALVVESQAKGRQHHQILDFGLKVVHGLMSIFWSATQHVVKSYDRNGELKQSYQPAKSRSGGVLKEA